MKKKESLTGYEQLVLTAVLLCKDDAYGMAVHEKVEELGGKRVQLPSVYITLDRLAERGYVEFWQTEATPERGNRRSRYFKVLPAGQKALAESVETSRRLMDSWDTFKWLKRFR